MYRKEMKSITEEGISFLARQQQDDGSFLSLSSPRQRDFVGKRTYQSTFSAALILSALSSLPDEKSVGDTKGRVARFLLSQKSEHWSFNYWDRDSKEAKAKPYPDDLDDTFCALTAMALYDKSLIDGAAMAKIVTLLTATEEKEGGPYRTWLVPEDAGEEWRDVDLAVNSNVAYFLSLQDIDLPTMIEMVESAIAKGDYSSRYYPLPWPVIYFISRWYRGDKVADVKQWLLEKRYSAGSWGNPLSTALAVTSLLNFGAGRDEVKRSAGYLVARQDDDGSWPAAAFCLDPTVEKKPHYAGSAALTTAFCLEALAKEGEALKAERLEKRKTAVPAVADEQQRVRENVIRMTRARFSGLAADLQRQLSLRLEQTVNNDKSGQIVLLPHYFRKSLGERAEKVDSDLILTLGMANLCGWIAYTIYDDFLDAEGDSMLLSVANVCLREVVHLFETALPDEAGFVDFALSILDRIDAANLWEVTHCRDVNKIPDYGDLSQLADKSLGHALGPAAILFAMGYKKHLSVDNLMSFFRHYLIARQLNDDAHDWEEDLKRGQVNAVGAMTLLEAAKNNVATNTNEDSLTKLRQLFWEDVIGDVCALVLEHVEDAKKVLGGMDIIEKPDFLLDMLDRVEVSAKQALEEKHKTQEFIKAYENA